MKVIFRLNVVCVLSVAMLSGCQSSRFPVLFVPGAAYHAGPAVVPPLTDTATASTSLPPEELEQPVLTAALPAEKEFKAIGGYARKLPVIKSFSVAAAQQTPPDTISIQQTARPTPDQMRDGDKLNTFIHSIGVVFLAIGTILIIVAFTAAAGWGALAALVYGVVALFISLPFLLFRSRKSTSYVLEQEARAARKASKVRK